MTTDEKKKELALFRLKQANEALDDAKYLLHGKKGTRSIINRTYYAMFYSVLALLVFDNFKTSKHSGVISYFNKNFVKEGLIPKELNKSIGAAFDLRQFGDYKEHSELTYDEVEPHIPRAEQFIKIVKDYLKKSNLI